MHKKPFYIIFFHFVFAGIGLAQTQTIDRLKNEIRLASNEQKIKAIFKLGELGYNVHPDTLMYYAEEAFNIAKQKNNLHDEVQALYYQSGVLTTKGLIDSSLAVADKCLSLMGNIINDPVLEGNVYNQRGRCFMRKNQYTEAIDMGYRVMKAAEKGKDVLLMIKGKTLVGWAYLELGQTGKAINWFQDAINSTQDSLLLQQYGIVYANLALCYNSLGVKDSAFININKAVRYSRMNENLFSLSNSLAIQAQLLVTSGKASQAEEPLKEVVEIRKKIGDPFYLVSDMAQLALFYANNGQPEKGIAISKEGIDIANHYKLGSKLLFLYSSLSANYKAKGNLTEYANTLEKIIKLKDSVFLKNTAQELAHLQANYELEKKERIIAEQKLKLVKKNYLLYSSLILSVLALLVFVIQFRNYKSKQKLKLEHLLAEEKILAAQSVKNAQEIERKRIAADLHDNLGAYAAAIAYNVNRAQQAENKESVLQELNRNAQEIVSQLNDTIWVLKKENLSLTAISDRIKRFIQYIQNSYPNIKIDVTEHIDTDILFPPVQAFNLFQIIKEAIINSLKHSSANNIKIYFESKSKWAIIISDDGIGIKEKDKQMGIGNGMENMRNRSKESGFAIDWGLNETGGTKVSIRATTN